MSPSWTGQTLPNSIRTAPRDVTRRAAPRGNTSSLRQAKLLGVSLLEVLVSIAVISLLLALLLPAVQSSRESSRRLRCAANMRQLAIAMHSFEAVHRAFPPMSSVDGSLQVLLMPYLDEPLAVRSTTHWDPNQEQEIRKYPPPPPVLWCPSDSAAKLSSEQNGATSYLGNVGTGVRWYGYNGVFSPWTRSPRLRKPPNLAGQSHGKVTVADIQDGLSQTAALAEILTADGSSSLRRITWQLRSNYQGPDEYEAFANVCTHHAFRVDLNGKPIGNGMRGRPWWQAGHGASLYNHIISPNGPSCIGLNGSVVAGAYTPASDHPAGVQVVFADGHSQTITSTIDLNIWRAIGSRADGEVITNIP